jgi:PhoH-like ATPase
MKKNYILDTNVLLHDPNALHSFQDNHIIIPIEVIEEVDHFKKDMSELGQNARRVSRILDGYRQKAKLADGVELAGGGTLRIAISGESLNGNDPSRNHASVDNHILALAVRIRDDDKKTPTVLVTKDINLRIKADAFGLRAEDYETDRVRLDDLYSGIVEMTVLQDELDAFHEQKVMALPKGEFQSNAYVMLRATTDEKKTLLGRVDLQNKQLVAIADSSRGVWGIRPRNREQYFAFDALLDDRIRLVTIMGKAGTGKTLLALAAGLQKVVTEKKYKRLLICRPTFPMGKEIGYLPGDIEDKLTPWMQPIYDSLELLMEATPHLSQKRGFKDFIRLGMMGIEPLTYIRGRSIAHQYIIIDEAQNLTPLEVKTVVTRVGHSTKIVFTGDPYQIDNPYVDSSSNGFNAIVNRFRSQPLAAHVELRKGERSELAELAANLL